MTERKWFDLLYSNELTQKHIDEWLSQDNSLDISNKDGNNALFYVKDIEIVKYLIEKGADFNYTRPDGINVFINACYGRNLTFVEYLIKKINNINQYCYRWHQSAMILASERDSFDLIKLLFDNGADINHMTKAKWTPLMLASRVKGSECCKIVEFLLQNNSNPYVINIYNKSVYDYANNDVKKIILKYYPYFLHKCIKKYIHKQNKNILNIKRINTPLNKLI